jgi:hypothetical protein
MNTQGLQGEILHTYLPDQSGPRIQPTYALRIARITGEVALFDLPDELPQGILEIDWSQQGCSWQKVRKARYGSWESQNEIQFDVTWSDHIAEFKRTTPKVNL